MQCLNPKNVATTKLPDEPILLIYLGFLLNFNLYMLSRKTI